MERTIQSVNRRRWRRSASGISGTGGVGGFSAAVAMERRRPLLLVAWLKSPACIGRAAEGHQVVRLDQGQSFGGSQPLAGDRLLKHRRNVGRQGRFPQERFCV